MIRPWSGGLTLQRIPGEAQLADDVPRNVGLDALTFFGVAFSRFQEMVELLWVKLL